MTITLTGDSLLSFVNEKMELVNRGEITRTDMIKDSGYINDNGTVRYTDFYTELLRSKGVTPVTDTDIDNESYDDLDSDTKELYDNIDKKFGENWDHEQVMEFIELLDDIGITTSDDLDESYENQTDSYNPESEFTEQYVTDVMDSRIPDIVYTHIDWYQVWDSELRYDFSTFEFYGTTYFFRNV
jgi:hypothetical protein